jgi:hypothetical protein
MGAVFVVKKEFQLTPQNEGFKYEKDFGEGVLCNLTGNALQPPGKLRRNESCGAS